MRFYRNKKQSTRRGFTAMEVAMVAFILAMFAVLVMPQFKDQVHKARLTAARADITSLMKAEILARSETGFYLRLEDLDNLADNLPTTMPANGVNKEVPFFRYTKNVDPTNVNNRPTMSEPEWRLNAKQFKGPYAVISSYTTLADLRNPTLSPQNRFMLRSVTGVSISPIQDFATNPMGGPIDDPNAAIPIDPWGNPYLFYPATGAWPGSDTSPASFFDSIIISLGPDGMPGTLGVANAPADFFRDLPTGNGIGTINTNSDDILVSF